MTFVGGPSSLLGQVVCDHVRGGLIFGQNVTFLSVLATEVATHVNVSGSRLIGGVQGHSDSAFVVAEEGRGGGLAESQGAE